VLSDSDNILANAVPGAFRTLEEWLDWQETLHGKEIDLRLHRVRAVLGGLGWTHAPWTVITVGGTNGKGSTVAMLESILSEAGYRVGAYTSPHLTRYNERIRMLREEVSDEELCEAFRRIERVRGDTTLTYFEFGTLAALDLFGHSALDVVVMEVGLGGRLDAVNAIDADVAIVSTVGIDHAVWLGDDRESIGREKAGIFRPGRPAICADPDPPFSLAAHARALGARLLCQNRDFGYESTGEGWRWWFEDRVLNDLPHPSLHGGFQLQNAAGVLTALALLEHRHPVPNEALTAGLVNVSLPMRCQVVPGVVSLILDVAHNPQAAAALALTLDQLAPTGRVHAVVGMLNDKDVEGVVAALGDRIDVWYPGTLKSRRGLAGEEIARRIGNVRPDAPLQVYESVLEALAAACESAVPGDLVVAFGSFYAMAELRARGATAALTGESLQTYDPIGERLRED
jgi:dihydrofolate synthase/folylpolyglutamate synthase